MMHALLLFCALLLPIALASAQQARQGFVGEGLAQAFAEFWRCDADALRQDALADEACGLGLQLPSHGQRSR